MRTPRYLAALVFLLIFFAGSSFGTILNVPLDYPTIQEAINASADSDTVLVQAGIYQETIDFLGKDIVVGSQYLYDNDSSTVVNTVIDANFSGSAVSMTSGETTAATLIGFTVMNGTGTLYEPGYGTFYVGGGFYLVDSSPTILNNIIKDNDTPDGGAGIFSDGGSPVIKNNVIVDNSSTSTSGCGAGMLIKNTEGGIISRNYIQFNSARHGGGIALKNADCEVTRNVITFNSAIIQAGGIRIYDQANPTIINNTISDNYAIAGTGGGVKVQEGSAPIFMNNIVSFTSSGGGFKVEGLCYPELSYNLFQDNVGGDYLGVSPGIGDITGDPAYVGGDPFDYHLTALSAAIDQGNPDPLYDDPDGTRNDCGAFYYPQGPATPVVLNDFSASLSGGNVLLSWSTAAEIDCYGWIVQRSQDDDTFRSVSPLIPGQGNSEETHVYSFLDSSVVSGVTYNYRLQQIDLSGAVTYSQPIPVSPDPAVVQVYDLFQNYPNPFNPQTAIVYTLPEAAFVRLAIYNAAGQLVEELVKETQPAGIHTVFWRAPDMPSGFYIYRLDAGDHSFTRKLTLIK